MVLQVLNAPEEKKGKWGESEGEGRRTGEEGEEGERGWENEEMRKTVGRENFRGAFLTCTRRRAHSNRNVVFLLSQVSHLDEKRGKSREKCRKNEREYRGKPTRKTASFDVVVRVLGKSYRRFVKTRQEKQTNHWYIKSYVIGCDTCDSKNTKTPGMSV